MLAIIPVSVCGDAREAGFTAASKPVLYAGVAIPSSYVVMKSLQWLHELEAMISIFLKKYMRPKESKWLAQIQTGLLSEELRQRRQGLA